MKPPKKPDPKTVYSDIIDLPRHEPDPIKHPRMTLYKRAAQFAPFAALRGYEDMVDEEIRTPEVDHRRELEEYESDQLNRQLNRIIALTSAGQHPTVIFTVYEADMTKAGGRYVSITDAVKRVDTVNRVIELMSVEGVMNRTVRIKDMVREFFVKINLFFE